MIGLLKTSMFFPDFREFAMSDYYDPENKSFSNSFTGFWTLTNGIKKHLNVENISTATSQFSTRDLTFSLQKFKENTTFKNLTREIKASFFVMDGNFSTSKNTLFNGPGRYFPAERRGVI